MAFCPHLLQRIEKEKVELEALEDQARKLQEAKASLGEEIRQLEEEFEQANAYRCGFLFKLECEATQKACIPPAVLPKGSCQQKCSVFILFGKIIIIRKVPRPFRFLLFAFLQNGENTFVMLDSSGLKDPVRWWVLQALR